MKVYSFAEFARRVLVAAQKGGLGQKDLKKLERLLVKDGKRNKVLASGLVSAMRLGGSKEVKKLGQIFERASERIAAGKPPFTATDADFLRSTLKNAGISEKTARWVRRNVDELLADEIKEFSEEGVVGTSVVPTKKTWEEKKKLALR